MPSTAELWHWILPCYLLTIALETPVLLVSLSRRHPVGRKLLAGVWLTACTYPIVWLVLPFLLIEPYGRTAYLVVAETFAPLAECVLFYFAFDWKQEDPALSRSSILQDMAAIVAANLVSFVLGEFLPWRQIFASLSAG